MSDNVSPDESLASVVDRAKAKMVFLETVLERTKSASERLDSASDALESSVLQNREVGQATTALVAQLATLGETLSSLDLAALLARIDEMDSTQKHSAEEQTTRATALAADLSELRSVVNAMKPIIRRIEAIQPLVEDIKGRMEQIADETGHSLQDVTGQLASIQQFLSESQRFATHNRRWLVGLFALMAVSSAAGVASLLL